MAKHKSYLATPKAGLAWAEKVMEEVPDYRYLPKVFEPFSKLITSYKKKDELGLTVEEQIDLNEKKMQKIMDSMTPEKMNKLLYDESDTLRPLNVLGTINWVIKHYGVTEPSQVMNMVNNVITAREESANFYENFKKDISEAMLAGKSVTRSAGYHLRGKDRTDIF